MTVDGTRSCGRQKSKAEAFVRLHAGEPFVIPNPWDAGSAKVLAALGYKALATTSSGFAFTLGRLDGQVTLGELVDHVRALDEATELPVSVDLENGYGAAPAIAADSVRTVAGAGAVAASIEDYDPDRAGMYPLPLAVDRIAAAAEAAHDVGLPFLLTARAENHIRGNPDLRDTVERLQAFAAAGADVLYAPGLSTVEDIRVVCEAVDKPVNVLARPDLSLEEIFSAGAQRVSVGGSLAWVAIRALADAATAIRDTGGLSVLSAHLPLADWLT